MVSTHFELPEYKQVEAAFMLGSDWNEKQQKTIRSIWEDLRAAYKFGSLIRVEEQLDALLPVDSTDMFANQWKADMFDFKHQMITTLRNQVHQWTGEGSNEYSLAKANDAITFLDILSTKFDVAVANPPYTDSADFGAELKEFVGANYSKPLKFNSNLYACFIKRCCELAGDDGKVGMIHPHTFMFIKTFEDVRKYLIGQTHVNVMVDYGLDRVNLFGPGILLDATFYTLDKSLSNKDAGVYFNITTNLQEKFKKDVLSQAYTDFCNGRQNDRVYQLPQSKLKDIKSYPFIYWISDEFRKKFLEKTLNDRASVVTGLMTGNNLKFLRYFWEVKESDISEFYPNDRKKWVWYQKGGPFNKWFGNNWLLVNFLGDGAELATTDNKRFYFKEGITYSETGSKSVSFRYLESKYVYDKKGPCIFGNENVSILYMLAFMNSKLSFYIVDCLNPTVSTQVGDTKRIPFIMPSNNDETIINNITRTCIDIKKYLYSFSIIESNFKDSPIDTKRNVYDSIRVFYEKETSLLSLILLNESVITIVSYKIIICKYFYAAL